MRVQVGPRILLVSAVVLALSLMLAVLLSSSLVRGAVLPPAPAGRATVEGIVLPRSTAAYNGVMTPATRLYAPWLVGGTSVLRVLNPGDQAVTVRAILNPEGDTLLDIPAGAVGEIQVTMVPTGTRASAILTASQPIAAVANDFGKDGAQAVSYMAMPAALGQPVLALPYVLHRASGGWQSEIVIQNVGDAATAVHIVYTQTNKLATRNWDDDSIVALAPGGVVNVSPEGAGLPENFEGIALIQAVQPLVAVVHNAAVGRVPAYIYRVPMPGALQESDSSRFFPLLVNEFEDWRNSEIQVMNAGPVRASFDIRVGEMITARSIDPWWAQNYPQTQIPNQDVLLGPLGEAVPGRVSVAPSLHGLVWLNGTGNIVGDSFAAYSAPGVAAKIWYLPFADQQATLITYVAVQNPGDIASEIRLTQHSLTGTVGAFSVTVAPQDLLLLSRGSGLPLQFNGGLDIEATQPVVAVAALAGLLELDQEIYMPLIKGDD
jgi:hypothetical protein